MQIDHAPAAGATSTRIISSSHGRTCPLTQGPRLGAAPGAGGAAVLGQQMQAGRLQLQPALLLQRAGAAGRRHPCGTCRRCRATQRIMTAGRLACCIQYTGSSSSASFDPLQRIAVLCASSLINKAKCHKGSTSRQCTCKHGLQYNQEADDMHGHPDLHSHSARTHQRTRAEHADAMGHHALRRHAPSQRAVHT